MCTETLAHIFSWYTQCLIDRVRVHRERGEREKEKPGERYELELAHPFRGGEPRVPLVLFTVLYSHDARLSDVHRVPRNNGITRGARIRADTISESLLAFLASYLLRGLRFLTLCAREVVDSGSNW